MSFRVRLHPAVADDLAAIAGMIARYAGPEAAERRLQDLVKSLRLTLFRDRTPM